MYVFLMLEKTLLPVRFTVFTCVFSMVGIRSHNDSWIYSWLDWWLWWKSEKLRRFCYFLGIRQERKKRSRRRSICKQLLDLYSRAACSCWIGCWFSSFEVWNLWLGALLWNQAHKHEGINLSNVQVAHNLFLKTYCHLVGLCTDNCS